VAIADGKRKGGLVPPGFSWVSEGLLDRGGFGGGRKILKKTGLILKKKAGNVSGHFGLGKRGERILEKVQLGTVPSERGKKTKGVRKSRR